MLNTVLTSGLILIDKYIILWIFIGLVQLSLIFSWVYLKFLWNMLIITLFQNLKLEAQIHTFQMWQTVVKQFTVQ